MLPSAVPNIFLSGGNRRPVLKTIGGQVSCAAPGDGRALTRSKIDNLR
jgi:hypothetical protein